jgi:hypothetical protein
MSSPRPAADTAHQPEDGPLRPEQEAALQRLTDALRDVLPAGQAGPTRARRYAEGAALLAAAEAGLLGARQRAEALQAQREKLEAKRQRLKLAAPTHQPADLRLVLDAAQALDGKLTNPDTLGKRLDEGLRSLRPKVHKLISEHLHPVIAVEGGQMVARVDPGGTTALASELPKWQHAWEDYVRRNLDHDLANAAEDLWMRLDKPPLVMAAPAFPALPVTRIEHALELPTVSVEREAVELASGALRHGRSLIYGLMSLAGLAGLRGSLGASGEATAGDRALFALGVGLLVIGAGAFGAYQTRRDRAREERRLHEQARERAERAVRDAVEHWLNRGKDKLTFGFTQALRAHRAHLRAWVSDEVRPTLARAEAQVQELEGQRAESERALEKLKDERGPRPQDLENAAIALRAAQDVMRLGPAPAERR